MSHRIRVLHLYKKLLTAVQYMPESSNPEKTYMAIANAFREAKMEKNTAKIEELLSQGEDRLRFMRVMLPRHAHDKIDAIGRDTSFESDVLNNVHRYVVSKDGRVIETTDPNLSTEDKAKYSNWRGDNIDPDALARHHASIRRFNFMDRGTAPPRAPTWMNE